MAQGFRLRGLEELQDEIKNLTEKELVSALRSSVKAGLKPVEEQAERQAMAFDDPSTPIRVYINLATRTRWRDGVMTGATGVVGGARSKGEPTQESPYYWRFRELGTEHQPARPFLRPALQNNAEEALNRFVDQFRRRVLGRNVK